MIPQDVADRFGRIEAEFRDSERPSFPRKKNRTGSGTPEIQNPAGKPWQPKAQNGQRQIKDSGTYSAYPLGDGSALKSLL